MYAVVHHHQDHHPRDAKDQHLQGPCTRRQGWRRQESEKSWVAAGVDVPPLLLPGPRGLAPRSARSLTSPSPPPPLNRNDY